jgi:CheY-like chemotaxis protein
MTTPGLSDVEDGIIQASEVPSKIRFTSRGRLTEDDFLLVREVLTEKRTTTGFQEILISFLPFILIIGLLYFLFVRQLKNAGKGAMSFGKSKAKMLTREKGCITFKDVAGCDEAKEEVSEVVDFLKDPKKFQRIGGRIPRGVLMVGPPGTGKTLLANAVAGEAESGEDAVRLAAELGPRLVLMDINLPGINGIEATQRILGAAPDTLVVLLSTYRESDLPADALACGARRYVHKEDFEPGVLLDVLGDQPITG